MLVVGHLSGTVAWTPPRFVPLKSANSPRDGVRSFAACSAEGSEVVADDGQLVFGPAARLPNWKSVVKFVLAHAHDALTGLGQVCLRVADWHLYHFARSSSFMKSRLGLCAARNDSR